MVRRKPKAEDTDKERATGSNAGKGGSAVVANSGSTNEDVAVEVIDTVKEQVSPQTRKVKKIDIPNSKKKCVVMDNAENSSELASPPNLLQLQSHVGKLNAVSVVMMQRMNFYEQQMELMWDIKDHAEQKNLLALYRQQTQKLVDQKSSQDDDNVVSLLDQLTIETHNLQEQERLTQQWIEKLECDRELYQQRLSLTYEELKAQKQRQTRTQRQLQKIQLQYERQLQLEQQRLLRANEELQNPATAIASAPSSHLVDDMMDSFYKEWSHKGRLPIDDDKSTKKKKTKNNK
ncbi:hypothetical protein IV203_032819 [Nitzschia inconspicua]|uniref:Uncharacterized protein n=1 Tax=Nitzschia inconspicua TaxID=303405 RepID=A0A9K3KM26_9STRA|nr:hypothetical protein IV203_032819 [Nitzschia inconspicua]